MGNNASERLFRALDSGRLNGLFAGHRRNVAATRNAVGRLERGGGNAILEFRQRCLTAPGRRRRTPVTEGEARPRKTAAGRRPDRHDRTA